MIFKINKPKFFTSVLFLIFTLLIFSQTQAQTTAFNFQGRLNDGGNAANGRYDLQFKLFDALAGGNQVASTINRANTQVINGVFSTVLDFGSAFTSGNRFLEIAVRPNGSSNAHIILGARQQILAVPFAVTSANTSSLGGVPASNYAQLNVTNSGSLSASGNLQIVGNATQNASSNGFVKSMLAVDGYVVGGPLIQRCFNGVTNSTSGNCGFTITEPLGTAIGVYRINFGFPVANRFVAVTCEYNSLGSLTARNCGANYKVIDNTSIAVFTFFTDDVEDTAPTAFTIILF